MALTANRDVDRYVDQELRALPVKAGVHVLKGALVGLSAGHARPLEAGDPFAGIAYEEMNNSDGDDADRMVRVYTLGDFEHEMEGATRAHNRRAVYASDDETLTAASDGNSFVGYQVDVPAAGRVIVRLRTLAHRAAHQIVTRAGAAQVAIAADDLGGVIRITGTTSGNLNLPSAADVGAGAWCTFIKAGASGTLTINPDGSETIDGAADNDEMSAAHDSITIVSDGVGWQIVARKIAV